MSIHKNKTLIFDGDILAHTIGGACEERSILVTHIKTGKTKAFKNRTEFWGRNKQSGWLAEQNEGKKIPWKADDFTIEDVQAAEPLENALHSVNVTIKSILKRIKPKDYRVLIGKGECFRHEILMPGVSERYPKSGRYKANRDDVIRAVHVDAIKNHLVKTHEAEVITGVETDDMLAHYCWEGHLKYLESGDQHDNNIIVATRDKDANAVFGWLFNSDWMEEPQYIEDLGSLWLTDKKKVRGLGRVFAYYQLLVGDASDGYKPSKTPNLVTKYGDMSALDDLSQCTNDKECLKLLANKYREWVPEPMTYEAWDGSTVTDNWLSWFQKHFDFVHMRRWEDDRVNVKELLDKYGCLKKEEKLWKI